MTTTDTTEQPCMCKQLAMPRPILTYPKMRKWSLALFIAAITSNLFGGLAPTLWPRNGTQVQNIALVAAAALLGVSFVVLYRMFACVEPGRGKLIYLDGRTVRVLFRPDPDRPEGRVYRAHRRIGRWPWSPTEPYDDSQNLATVVVRTGQLHQALRIGETVIPLFVLVRLGMKVHTGPDLSD